MKISLIAHKTAFEILLWNGLEILLWEGENPLFTLSYKNGKFILGDDEFETISEVFREIYSHISPDTELELEIIS